MKHLIAQGLKQKTLIKASDGFRPINSNVYRGVHHIGNGVGHMRISEDERALRTGEGFAKKIDNAYK